MPRKWIPGDPQYGQDQSILFGLFENMTEAEAIASPFKFFSIDGKLVTIAGRFVLINV